MSSMKRTRWSWAVAVVVLAVTAGACGSDDEASGPIDSATTGSAAVDSSSVDSAVDSSSADSAVDSSSADSAVDSSTVDSSTVDSVAAGEQPQSGGKLVMAHQLDPNTLNPINASYGSPLADSPQMVAIFDQLLFEDPTTSKVVPQLAESLTTTDSVMWTLTLRPGVTFTDGTVYDAAAVMFNIERHQDPANKSPHARAAQTIQSMEVVDPLTLRFTLVEANGQFDRLVARDLGLIASPTALEAKGEAFGDSPVGAGPFMVKEWVRGSRLSLVRNPTYWNAPKPYLDELEFQILGDPSQRLNALQTGQVQVSLSGSTPAFNQQYADAGFTLYEHNFNIAGGIALLTNTTRAPFDDVRMRLAVAYGVNLEEFNNVLLDGHGTVPTQLIRPPSPFADPTLTLPTYDPVKAQELVDEYTAEKGSPEFTFLVSPSAPWGEFLQAEMAKLGVKTNVELLEGAQFVPRMTTGDFQVASFGLGGSDPEPGLYDHLHTGGFRNFGGYSNPEVDAALEAARATSDEAVRAEAYATVQRDVIRDMPDIWVLDGRIAFGLADSVQDFAMSTVSPLWDRVWLKE